MTKSSPLNSFSFLSKISVVFAKEYHKQTEFGTTDLEISRWADLESKFNLKLRFKNYLIILLNQRLKSRSLIIGLIESLIWIVSVPFK